MPLRVSARVCTLPINLWPDVCIEALPDIHRETFAVKKKALILYFTDVSVRSICQLTGVSRTALSKMAKRCQELADDGQILGFRALIPYVRLQPYARRSASTLKLSGAHGGCSGELQATLAKIDGAEKRLVGYIKQDAKVAGIPEKKLRPKDLHRIYLKFLKANGVKEPDWPFNTKYLGIRSIQKYMVEVLARNFSTAVSKREEKDARAHLSVGKSREPILHFEEPYDAVEIDAYRIENHTCVTFRTPEDTFAELLLERMWLIAAVDRSSSAVLAYRMVYRTEVTADDVAAVIRDAITKRWEPQPLLFPGLKYPPKGGVPNGVIPRAYGAVWSVTMLDGALAHLAEKIHDRVRKAIGFVINWGPGGHFERRPNVERTFKQLGQDLYRRLPSTTGSHPHNGRADDAEQKAVLYKIKAVDADFSDRDRRFQNDRDRSEYGK
jgi:putative transposase